MSVTDINEKIEEKDEENKAKFLSLCEEAFDTNTPYGLFIFDPSGQRQIVSNLQAPALFWLIDTAKLSVMDSEDMSDEVAH
jgi:hypothetical protein